MNKIILMGRLTKDPDMRSTQSGTAVAHFSLAVDRRFKKDGEDSADFFNCSAFGKQAEFTEKYLKKGTKILCSGRMESSNYTNRDGAKVMAWQVALDEIEFAESKKAQGAQPEQTDQKQPDWMPADDLADDELPFKF